MASPWAIDTRPKDPEWVTYNNEIKINYIYNHISQTNNYMPHSLAYNYIHLVFSTKYREHTIVPEIEQKLYDYIAGICKNLESPALQEYLTE